MIRFDVVFDPQAERQARNISEWWRANRRASSLFDHGLEAAVSRLRRGPGFAGRPYRTRRANVYRLLLRRTSYHVYFVGDGDTFRVLAIWHAARGKGPPL